MDSSRLFRDRLRRDLRDIEINHDPGIHVQITANNMRRLCLQLTPKMGPWQGLTVHFRVELSANWVSSSFATPHTVTQQHILSSIASYFHSKRHIPPLYFNF